MAKLYTNENFPVPAVSVLRELGHDVLTSADAGEVGRAVPDEAVLAYAVTTERILITLNRKHFIRLHNENTDHFGIVVCTVDADFAALAQRIHVALLDSMRGQLVRVNREDKSGN